MICVLVWVINIRRFNDPVHGNWVSTLSKGPHNLDGNTCHKAGGVHAG